MSRGWRWRRAEVKGGVVPDLEQEMGEAIRGDRVSFLA